MLNELPLISVVIPAYNCGHFIRYALDSVLSQDYPEDKIEIIIIDDGSTDNTAEVVGLHSKRSRLIRSQNRGIASARNTGIFHAHGEIITFLDADDIWHEKRLYRVAEELIVNPDAGLAYHPIELIDREGITIAKDFYKTFGYIEGLNGWITNSILSGRVFCGGSSFSFRKHVIERACPVPEEVRRGVDFYITAVSSCYAKASYIPEILSKYRAHEGNTTFSRGAYNCRELAEVNRDFAFMRQKVFDKISDFGNTGIKAIDLSILKRLQAKEEIFYNVLAGKRLEGIRRIPELFRKAFSVNEFLKGTAAAFMALLMPAFLYPKLVRAYGLLKKFESVRFIRGDNRDN